MNEDGAPRIAQALARVPQGSVQLDAPEALTWAGDVAPRTGGRGWMALRDVLPGVRMAVGLFQAGQASLARWEGEKVLEIHHCWSGRAGWNLRDGRSVYLGEGDVVLHSLSAREDGVTLFPLGYEQGITLWADLETLAKEYPPPLEGAGVDLEEVYQRFCAPGKPLRIPMEPELAALCSALHQGVHTFTATALEEKALAFLMYLFRPQTQGLPVLQFRTQQTDLMRVIHAQLIANLDHRITIGELSKQHFVNTSTLKAAFKVVYGQPIASYMKAYRVHEAMESLRDSDESIASLSLKLGYETQGKFAKAFKNVARMTPSQYRQGCRG